MKYSEWIVPQDAAEIPSQLTEAGYPPLLAAVLSARGAASPEAAASFLEPGPETLGDPLLLTDMDRAAERLRRAVSAKETVAVFGDYDVDGITSACLVTSWLTERGVPCFFYIPDRMEEGYGLSDAAVETIAARGASLIVTVDCGITAAPETKRAAALGVDMIVTDHHECDPDGLPQACAVVDPKRPDSAYPNRDLAGVGVAFKLLCAAEGSSECVLSRYADLIATGTVADVMPLTGENRYIVRRGLASMTASPRPGIAALLRESGAGERRLTAATVGFTLAPRLNAAGRLGQADVAARLLLSREPAEADALAGELCRLNRERQALEQDIFEQARAMLAKRPPAGPIVLAGEGWHQGVIGIAASKLAEEHALPAVMICLDGDMGKGSCRSFGGFNLYDALSAVSDTLEGFGGHALAAGLTIRRDHVEAFRAALADYYARNPGSRESALTCDLRIEDPDLLSMEDVQALERLEPFGAGNPRPTFCIADAELEHVSAMGGGKHLRVTLRKGNRSFEGVFFSRTEEELGLREGDAVDAAFYPQINEYRSRRSVQLLLTDLRPTDETALCRELLSGREPAPWESAELCPWRADFVQIWRAIERRGGRIGGRLADIGAWKPEGERAGKLILCLRVMEERGLVHTEWDGDSLFATARQPAAKADLDGSALLQRLRKFRELY